MKNYGSVTAKQIVRRALRKSTDHVIIMTPIVWQPDGKGGKRWYFTISTNERGRGWRADMVTIKDDIDKAAVMASFVGEKPPAVIFDAGTELEAAKMCEALWPGERITQVRQSIEAGK
jgi:hypothetical protein